MTKLSPIPSTPSRVREGETMTRTAHLLETLQRRWLTPLDAVHLCCVFSLSQRVGEFRRAGHTVIDRWEITRGGSRVKAYKITKLAKPKDRAASQ